MKNLNQIIRIAMTATALVLFAGNFSAANDGDKGLSGVRIEVTNVEEASQKAVFSVVSLPQGKVSIRVMDSEGHVLYTERGEASARYAKMYDFSKVGTGTYTVQIRAAASTGSQTEWFKVKVTKDGLNIEVVQ